MAECDLSQSELARRVGVTQTTIRKLVSGEGYGSKYLHVIARELGTTPAYLTGETDDPVGEGPPAKPVDSETRELNEHFAELTPADRRALLQIARSMSGNVGSSETVHAGKSEHSSETRS